MTEAHLLGHVDPPPLEAALQRRYRVRIAGFLAVAVLGSFALSTLFRTINTLQRLEFVEAARDRWQRPAEVVRAMGPAEGKVVADLGAGAGYFALKLSAAVGRRGRVLGVDIRRLPLLFLEIRAVLQGRHNVSTALADLDDPHLPAGAVDAVLIANTYHELTDRAAILAHLLRALRPGGRVVVVDPEPGGAGEGSAETVAHHHESPASAEAELRRAGFEIMSRQDRFIDDGGRLWWLIVGRRPEALP